MKRLNKQTLLIGLDGATFTLLDVLTSDGTMPFLKKLMKEGCKRELTSVFPPLTPPGWTSITTGCWPGTHGILDFLRFESPKSRYLKWISFRDIRRETIWSIVSRHGMRAGSLNFIAMNPPPSISGYVIPGFVSWRFLKKNSYPEGLFDRLSHIPEFDLKEMALNFREEEKAVKNCHHEEYESWVSMHIRRDRQWFRVVRYLMEHDPCHLTGIVFDGLDRIQHLCWHLLDPASRPESLSPHEERARQLCLQYFEELDRFMEEIVSLAGPEANTFIVSDHGFGPSQKILYINQWLCEQGYLKWKNYTQLLDEDDQGESAGSTYRSLLHLDWERTGAYAVTASGNGIFIQVAGKKGEEGISEGEYLKFREELIENLQKNCLDPQTGEPMVKEIFTKEKIFAGDFLDFAPDLILLLQDNNSVCSLSVNPAKSYLKVRSRIAGAHRLEGVFIAAGPAIQKGHAFDPLSIIHVAPTMLYTLGLPIPKDMEGQLMTEIFKPSFLRMNPMKIGAPTLPPERHQSTSPQTEHTGGEEQIMLRLKSLGYI